MKNLFKLLLLCLFTINFTSCKDHIPEVEDLPEELLNFTYQEKRMDRLCEERIFFSCFAFLYFDAWIRYADNTYVYEFIA